MGLAFDFFAGTGSSTQALEDRGWKVIRFELDRSFDADVHEDVLELDVPFLLGAFGRPDFVWASPPCTSFSIAAMGHHWDNRLTNPTPKTETAKLGIKMVSHTVRLIAGLQPRQGWLMENPRGMLRKMDAVKGLPMSTISYCQYGDFRMKPTDVWGGINGWLPSKMCKNNSSCHEAAPRGANSGTQGMRNAKEKSVVPYGLSFEIADKLKA